MVNQVQQSNDLKEQWVRQRIEDRMLVVRQSVDEIINNDVTSDERIRELLDKLLNCTYFGIGGKEFIRLNRYYSCINKQNSQMYTGFYHGIILRSLLF